MILNRKNKGILLGTVLMSCASYTLVVSPVLSKWVVVKQLENKYKTQKLQVVTLDQLKEEHKHYTKELANFHIGNNTSFQQLLLQQLQTNLQKNKVNLISFQEPHRFNEQNTSFENYVFRLEGRFKDLLQVLYTLEHIHSFGKINSVSFETLTNYKTKRKRLECEVYIQRISQNTSLN